MIHRRAGLNIFTGGFAALVLAGASASAQTAAGEGGLGEIVVTAQRRAENLQEVPISMSALTGATLENLGMNNFFDYATTVPNLAIGVGGGAGGNGNGFGVSTTRAVTIRGVAGANTTSFYLNDTPIPLSLDPRVLDIDHVEVLRGPQGTLFGGGSMGGTVRLITRDPSLHGVSGKIEAEGSYVNDGGPGYSINGTANVPLIEGNAALRVSAFSAYTPGWFTRTWGVNTAPPVAMPPNAPVGQKDHVGATQDTGFVASLSIAPAGLPGFTVTPMMMYQKSTSNGYPTADYSPDNLVQNRPLNVPEAVEDTWTFAGVTAKYDAGVGRLIASGTYFWRNAFDREDGTDFTAAVYPGLPYYVAAPLYNNMYYKTWTGEVRFESTLQGPFQFVVGGFSELKERRYVETFPAPGVDAASGGILGTDNLWIENAPNADRERAVFVNLSYDVTSALQLSAGVRRAHLSHQFLFDIGGYGAGGAPISSGEASDNNTSPRFTARYQLTPDDMIYASAGKGFRVGGRNFPVPPLCDASLAAVGLQNGSPFTSDSIWSFELGMKDSWLGGRIKSRLAAYRIDWTNIQQLIVLQCSFDVTTNTGAATSTGAELEIDAALADRLTLNLNAGYEDAKITEVEPGSVTVLGQPLNGVPRWNGSAILQYSVPTPVGSAFFRAVATSVGSSVSYNNVAYPGREVSGYTLFNARTGVDRGPWNIALFADNLFDRRANLGDITPEVGELPGRPRWRIAQPRTIGLHIRRDF